MLVPRSGSLSTTQDFNRPDWNFRSRGIVTAKLEANIVRLLISLLLLIQILPCTHVLFLIRCAGSGV